MPYNSWLDDHPFKADGIDNGSVFPTGSSLLPIGLRGRLVGFSELMSSCIPQLIKIPYLHLISTNLNRTNQTNTMWLLDVATALLLSWHHLIPIMKGLAGGGIYKYLPSKAILPPITAFVFLLGLFEKNQFNRSFVGNQWFHLRFTNYLLKVWVFINWNRFPEDLVDFNLLFLILFLVSVIIISHQNGILRWIQTTWLSCYFNR